LRYIISFSGNKYEAGKRKILGKSNMREGYFRGGKNGM